MSPQYDLASASCGTEICSSPKLLLNSSMAMNSVGQSIQTNHRLARSSDTVCTRHSLALTNVDKLGCIPFSDKCGFSSKYCNRRHQLSYAVAADFAETRNERKEVDQKVSAATTRQSSILEKLQFDVVIVGAGIIGLSIAHRLLSTTSLSVALVDAARPCSGATGAGQGYVWLGHKSPETLSWPLSKRSNLLWDEFAKELDARGSDPLVSIGYKKTGSLLFGTSSEDALALRKRAELLCNGGVRAEFLDSTALRDVEPQLYVGVEGSAVFTSNDCQIDAHLAASYIAGENRKYCSSGRFEEIFYDPASNFLWSDQHAHIVGVQTTRHQIYCNNRVIMAAGAWSGDLMQGAFKKLELPLVLATKPRKGHLLVFEGLSQVALRHGIMEFAYNKLADSANPFGIASTATLDAQGRLLLGSSRQFAGFDFSLQYDVMESILRKAAEYLPILGNTHLAEALSAGTVRIGHRPYVPDGRPMIGEIPGLEGLLLATGHEGEGLSLSLGTAEMVVNLLLEEGKQVVDPSPFSPRGRLAP